MDKYIPAAELRQAKEDLQRCSNLVCGNMHPIVYCCSCNYCEKHALYCQESSCEYYRKHQDFKHPNYELATVTTFMKEKLKFDISQDGELFYQKVAHRLEETFDEFQDKLLNFHKFSKNKKIKKIKNLLQSSQFKGKNSLKQFNKFVTEPNQIYSSIQKQIFLTQNKLNDQLYLQLNRLQQFLRLSQSLSPIHKPVNILRYSTCEQQQPVKPNNDQEKLFTFQE